MRFAAWHRQRPTSRLLQRIMVMSTSVRRRASGRAPGRRPAAGAHQVCGGRTAMGGRRCRTRCTRKPPGDGRERRSRRASPQAPPGVPCGETAPRGAMRMARGMALPPEPWAAERGPTRRRWAAASGATPARQRPAGCQLTARRSVHGRDASVRREVPTRVWVPDGLYTPRSRWCVLEQGRGGDRRPPPGS